jgi:hypothetical protein
MTCVHLQQLYDLCDKEGLKLSSSDLIHIVCNQCGKQDVCPSTLSEHYPEASGADSEPSEDASGPQA